MKAKRVLDVLLSAAGLLLLLPLLPLVALAIRLDSRGPVFFGQERVGRHLRPFRIWKLRTMVRDAEARGPRVTPEGDPRVTRVGRLLRRTKLDELPQLWNVLRGDMSLVGPRPEVPAYVRHYLDDYREILRVRPGITDPAAIAFRDEAALLEGTEDAEAVYLRRILPQKLRMSRRYVEHASLLRDLRLLFETVFTLAYPAAVLEGLIARLDRWHRALALLAQAGLAAGANLLAMTLRFDGPPPVNELHRMLPALPLLLVIRTAWFRAFKLDRDLWKYVGLGELASIGAAVAFGSLSFWLALLASGADGEYSRAVLVLDALLCATALGGVRILRRMHRELRNRIHARRRVLVVGANRGAEHVVRGLLSRPELDVEVLGLVTPDGDGVGLRMHTVPILGGLGELEGILRSQSPDEVLVLPSDLPSGSRRDVLRRCRGSGHPVRVVPGLDDLLTRHGTDPDDEPEANDLLFRDPVPADLGRVRGRFQGHTVMVTGGGGSIGSEICRQLAACEPGRLVMFEKHEESLYHIERELRARFPGLELEAVIGDVRDAARVREVLEATRPSTLFHAAAYKHVPMMEHNPSEAVKTNVLGTRTVAAEAARAGVGTFVLISTDKAVEPVSVMGATKRMAELVLQNGVSHGAATRFLTVRFGNVLQSSGSVVPLFREQILNGGPVTVTHADATRWFMTVPEAVQLILEASGLGRGGEVFVLDMGRPVRILDLAHALIRQYGLVPDRDVRIEFTGLRPGERLFEKLFNDHEQIWKTSHPRVLMAAEASGHAAECRDEEFRRLLHQIESVTQQRSARDLHRVAAVLLDAEAA